MKRIISGVLALGVCLTPLTVPLMVRPSWGQSENLQEEVQRLLEQARQQSNKGEPLQAIGIFQQVLVIARQNKVRQIEAKALLGIGFNYNNIGRKQEALDSYKQALAIWQEANNRLEEAATLNEIGLVYLDIGQSQEALKYFNLALPIRLEVNDRAGEATTLNNIGVVYLDIGQSQEALKYFNLALPIIREVNDRTGEATTLYNIGAVYKEIGQLQEALKYYKLALPIKREVNNRVGEATTLYNIAGIYHDLGQLQEALQAYNLALPIMREVNDRLGEATILNNIGLIYRNIGQPEEALKSYNLALPILRDVNNRSGEATTLTNIGNVYQSIGQPKEALKYFKLALPILREVNNRAREAITLNNIGNVYQSIGQPQEALKYFKLALPILQEVNDRAGEATTLNNMGANYQEIGQLQESLKYYNLALLIVHKMNNRPVEAAILNNIGAVYRDIGQIQEALKYYNLALPIVREVNNRFGEAAILNNIGLVYGLDFGQPEEALKYFNLALRIMREVNDRAGEATTLNNIGGAYGDIGEPLEALKYYNLALSIRREREVDDRPGEAITLSNIGGVYRDIGQPKQAISNWEQSIKITLEMRGGLQKENRQKFLESDFRGGTSIALISLLIDQNQPDRAFQYANRVTTADLADYTRLINAKVSNPQAQKLIDQWNQKNQQIQFLYRQFQSNPSDQLSQQINAFQEQNNKLAEDISRQFPEVAELFETTLTDIEKLRSSIPAGTVVIQPVLLTDVKNVPNTVAIFIVTKDQLSVIKKQIDPTEFDKLLTEYREQMQNTGDDSYKENSAKIYDILIRPVEDKIKAFSPKQLSIIATGKLRYIPFETLFDEQTDQYLIQKYPINYLTRLSSRSLNSNVDRSFLQKGILALGNPIPNKPYNMPNAPVEVQSITQILSNSQVYIGNSATLETFKTQAPRFPILHLATHGCFLPEGCCLLDSPDCRKPDKLDLQPNTILFADQQLNIANAALLGLQNTELLTLSACQTALQANSNGEEIAGLAYIFERAGAKAVMASLWNVEDNTTKEIMIEFYQNIKNGMSKGEALQKAKLSQIDKHHPYYWSPFILIGDAR